MATPSRFPYPPCVSEYCGSPGCCTPGYQYQWPELVGKDGQYARGVIEADNPLVTAVTVPYNARGITDFCCNRVYVYLDVNRKVAFTPRVG